MKFTLPGFEYFSNSRKRDNENPKKAVAGSPYSGSVGTDPLLGCLSVRTFNYRILLYTNLEKVTTFIAESWVNAPCKPGVGPQQEDYEEKIFDGTENSLPLMEEWLAERHSLLMGEE